MSQPTLTIIYGPQGSNKTTVARIIADLFDADEVVITTFANINTIDYDAYTHTKVFVLDEVPETTTLIELSQLKFFTGGPAPIGETINPTHIIAMVQTSGAFNYLEERAKEDVPLVSFINSRTQQLSNS